MIVWFTGNSGAGKSTLAKAVRKYFSHSVWLDGDALRRTISLDKGFSAADRQTHNLNVARLANMLSRQGHLVLVSVIAPFQELRRSVGRICDPAWIYVKRDLPSDDARPYEEPVDEFTILNDWAGDFRRAAQLNDAADACVKYILKQADVHGISLSL